MKKDPIDFLLEENPDYEWDDIHDVREIAQTLEERVKNLEETVTNLQQECQRLYQTGFSNGVEVARKEYADQLKKLEDRGLISFYGFLNPEPKEVYDKWVKAWEDWGKKDAQIHPIEDECIKLSCDHTCENLIKYHNAFDNTTTFKCTKLNKLVSLSDDDFISLSPADFLYGRNIK